MTGKVFEYYGMIETLVHNFEILSTGNPLPLIEFVNTGDIATGSTTAELYEGILVQVN